MKKKCDVFKRCPAYRKTNNVTPVQETKSGPTCKLENE